MKQKSFFTDDLRIIWNFKRNSDGFNNINLKSFPAAFFSIIGIMTEDCNYHIKQCYSSGNRLFFTGYYHNHPSELMLRYGNSELVVARIMFAHKRVGNMTRLFETLKHIKRSYHINKIVIECVQTDEMRAWCIKNNFTPCGNPDGYGINWEWK